VVTRLAAMPGITRLPLLLVLLAILAVLPGCGSDESSGEIPQVNATALNQALDGVSSAIATGNCEAAASQAEEFGSAVNRLPADPSADLKPELQDAADNLRTLVDTECVSTQTTQPTSTQQPETSSTTSTTSSTTSSTEETDTTSTGTTTTSTDETEPPANGQGQGPGGGGPPGHGGTGGTGGGTGADGGE
jgi:hypothetical protein